jgi:hypothetical protein
MRPGPDAPTAQYAVAQVRDADPDRRQAEVVTAEVSVSVIHEGAARTGWRYAVLAVALIAVAAGLTSTRLGTHRHAPPRRAATVRVHAGTPARCVNAPGYGGLGARTHLFDANNDDSTGPAGPTPGSAWYWVTATSRGCITAFAVQDAESPPLTASDLLFRVSHPFLPRDAKQLVNIQGCAVWESEALRRATGRAYARATAIPQTGTLPGRAQIQVTPTATC